MGYKHLLAGPLLLLCISVACADSISPSSVSATLDQGESMTIHKVVTVSTEAPSTSMVDVYFLADTTGSMGSILNAVKSSANNILTTVAGIGGNVQFAVGNYRDFPKSPYGGPSDYAYKLDQSMTANQASAQAGINAWVASGGNDTPEGQLAALEALSQSASAAVGWRAGSEKIVVWFGDAPGHDSASEPGYPGPTEAATIAALQSQGIQVLALNVGYGGLDNSGQATRITAATGGTLYNGINTTTIADAIIDAIETAYDTYSTVGLDLSGVPAGVGAVVSPLNITGSYDRSVERTFEFDVTLTGLDPGDYSFAINALVDGGVVATENDRIKVVDTSAPGVPDGGSSLLLLGLGLGGLGLLRRSCPVS